MTVSLDDSGFDYQVAMAWHYEQEGDQQGPVSVDELRQAIAAGTVDCQTLVWRQGLSGWQALEEVAELSGLLGDALPPVPVPPPLPASPPPPPALPRGSSPVTINRELETGPKPSDERFWGRSGRLAQFFRAHPAIFAGLIGTMVVGSLVCWVYFSTKPTPSEPPVLGRLRVDANPWGEVRWVRAADGTDAALPQERTTPMLSTVPVGSYRAEVHYPHASVTKQCSVQVRDEGVAVCWVDLVPLDARAYFQKIGW